MRDFWDICIHLESGKSMWPWLGPSVYMFWCCYCCFHFVVICWRCFISGCDRFYHWTYVLLFDLDSQLGSVKFWTSCWMSFALKLVNTKHVWECNCTLSVIILLYWINYCNLRAWFIGSLSTYQVSTLYIVPEFWCLYSSMIYNVSSSVFRNPGLFAGISSYQLVSLSWYVSISIIFSFTMIPSTTSFQYGVIYILSPTTIMFHS